MAITLRGELPAAIVVHSDPGTQHALAQITAFAAKNGLTRSMGYTGICWDNGMASPSCDVGDRVLPSQGRITPYPRNEAGSHLL